MACPILTWKIRMIFQSQFLFRDVRDATPHKPNIVEH